MKYLSTGDLLEVVPIRSTAIDRWVDRGLLQPVEGGHGTGNHRRFTPMQAVGVAMAVKLRAAAVGCSLDFAGQVVERIGTMTEAELVAEFERGNTHLLPVAGLPLEPPRGCADDDDRDVRRTFEAVMKRIKEIENSLPTYVGGRKRGLARSATGHLVGASTR